MRIPAKYIQFRKRFPGNYTINSTIHIKILTPDKLNKSSPKNFVFFNIKRLNASLLVLSFLSKIVYRAVSRPFLGK